MGTSNAGNGHRQHDESYSKPVSACCSSLTERIAKVAPTANRCMIENMVDEPVEFVHLIPPTGIPSVVSRSFSLLCDINDFQHVDYLEYSWKKKPGTLNLHTRYNSMLRTSPIDLIFNHWYGYYINSWYQTSRSIQQGKMDSPPRTTYTSSLPRWQVWSNVCSTSNIGTFRFLDP